MKKTLFALLLSLFAAPAFAQATYPTPAGSRVNGVVPLVCDASGINCAPASAANPDIVQGPAATDAPAAGNPVLIGCVYNATSPTVTAGDISSCQATQRGSIKVTLFDTGANSAGLQTWSADDVAAASIGLTASNLNYGFDGAAADRLRTVNGAATAGTGTQAVALAPSTAAGAALASVVSTTAESSRVFKSGAGNAYEWQVSTGIVAGYVLVFDATAAPADGVVTPIQCVAVAASSTVGSTMHTLPERFATGYTVVFSTTGCFTKTASATAFIRARVL